VATPGAGRSAGGPQRAVRAAARQPPAKRVALACKAEYGQPGWIRERSAALGRAAAAMAHATHGGSRLDWPIMECRRARVKPRPPRGGGTHHRSSLSHAGQRHFGMLRPRHIDALRLLPE